MTAAAGSLVRIYYDGRAELEPGHALMSTTGRTYIITEARRQEYGKHRGRWHLRCLVADGKPALNAVVYPLVWYRRGRPTPARRPPPTWTEPATPFWKAVVAAFQARRQHGEKSTEYRLALDRMEVERASAVEAGR